MVSEGFKSVKCKARPQSVELQEMNRKTRGQTHANNTNRTEESFTSRKSNGQNGQTTEGSPNRPLKARMRPSKVAFDYLQDLWRDVAARETEMYCIVSTSVYSLISIKHRYMFTGI